MQKLFSGSIHTQATKLYVLLQRINARKIIGCIYQVEASTSASASTEEETVGDISPLLLYVEDDFQQRMLLSEILGQSGFRVLSAPCAREGLELAAREDFDAVVVDYDLPDMTGAQLAQEIRALEPSAKIILLSGRPELPPGELVYIDIHVVKGSLTEKLIETIYALINSQNLTAAASRGCYYA